MRIGGRARSSPPVYVIAAANGHFNCYLGA
jgi:hypothetical protein